MTVRLLFVGLVLSVLVSSWISACGSSTAIDACSGSLPCSVSTNINGN